MEKTISLAITYTYLIYFFAFKEATSFMLVFSLVLEIFFGLFTYIILSLFTDIKQIDRALTIAIGFFPVFFIEIAISMGLVSTFDSELLNGQDVFPTVFHLFKEPIIVVSIGLFISYFITLKNDFKLRKSIKELEMSLFNQTLVIHLVGLTAFIVVSIEGIIASIGLTCIIISRFLFEKIISKYIGKRALKS